LKVWKHPNVHETRREEQGKGPRKFYDQPTRIAMRAMANNFRQINQALSFASMRLQARAETRLLAQEVENARDNLCFIEETFAEIQRDHEQSIQAIIQSEAQLRQAIVEIEGAIRKTPAPRYFSQSISPDLFRLPRGKDRIVRARGFLTLLESAPFSLGFNVYSSKLRQCIFALEDAFRRHDAMLLTRANALRERSSGLLRAQKLFQRLVLQTKLLFPKSPFLLEVEDRFLPRAA
jgi:hypothetical protein